MKRKKDRWWGKLSKLITKLYQRSLDILEVNQSIKDEEMNKLEAGFPFFLLNN